MPHRILSLQQAARHIRIPERELFHLVQRDEIPFLRQGDDVVFEHRVLDDWAQRRILGLPGRALSEHHRQETAGRTGKDSTDILIERLCRPEWIVPALTAKTKPGVIRDMVALAVTTGLLYDDAALQREIEEREDAGSTAIGGGAASVMRACDSSANRRATNSNWIERWSGRSWTPSSFSRPQRR